MNTVHVDMLEIGSCFPVKLMHVIEVSDGKWNCGECRRTGRKAEGSETIKRKSSNDFSHGTVWCPGVTLSFLFIFVFSSIRNSQKGSSAVAVTSVQKWAEHGLLVGDFCAFG